MQYYSLLRFTIFRHLILRREFSTKISGLSDLKENQELPYGYSQTIPLFKKALSHANKFCITDFAGQYTYLQLYNNSKRLSRQISNICGSGSNSTVAFFISNDILIILILWAIWMSGQKAFALKRGWPTCILSDLINKTNTKLIISPDILEKQSRELAFENSIALMQINHNFLDIYLDSNGFKREEFKTLKNKQFFDGVLLNEFYNNSKALIVHTNENITQTISRSHKEFDAQIKNTVQSWNISKNDRILCICPSYDSYKDEYIYTISAALSVGSNVHIFEPFNSKAAWRLILGKNISPKERMNVLIAEPIVYQMLIQEYNRVYAGDKRMVDYIKDYCLTNIRLMISCFIRCDPFTFCTWTKITQSCLLESDYSSYILNINQVENVLNNKSGKTYFLKHSNMRMRIIDDKNNVLLDLIGTQMEKISTLHSAVVGRLLISNTNDLAFNGTGKIVSYSKGIFKIIGRYLCSSN